MFYVSSIIDAACKVDMMFLPSQHSHAHNIKKLVFLAKKNLYAMVLLLHF